MTEALDTQSILPPELLDKIFLLASRHTPVGTPFMQLAKPRLVRMVLAKENNGVPYRIKKMRLARPCALQGLRGPVQRGVQRPFSYIRLSPAERVTTLQ